MSIEIIAEAAQGYEGNPTLALMIARAASCAHADGVKFQIIYADELAIPDYKYYELFKKLEMPSEAWLAVADEAKSAGMRIYFDIFGEKSLGQAKLVKADGVKIHTTDFFNTKLIQAALKNMLRIFISFGGISVEELRQFIEQHQIKPRDQVTFMYGFQAEPTPLNANNLLKIISLQQTFPGYQFGFMDHAEGGSQEAMTLALMTLPMNITCIEKHITLDRTLKLEDYVSALTGDEFLNFVQKIKSHETALGKGNLIVTPAELEYRSKVVKVVVASQKITKGKKITESDISLKRVGQVDTSSFFRIEEVVGSILDFDLSPNQVITKGMIS